RCPWGAGPPPPQPPDDRLAAQPPPPSRTTVAGAYPEPRTGEMRYACAGPPPPLLVDPSGSPRFLDGGRSAPLIGLEPGQREEDRVAFPPGSTLILYTDGLVERRGSSLDDRLESLAEAAAAGPVESIQDLADTPPPPVVA